MMLKILIQALLLLFLWSGPVEAGGAIMKRQQLQQQKALIQQRIRQEQMQKVAEQAQRQATQRAVAEQKRMIQEVAVQKAVIQREIAAAQLQAARQAALAQQRALQQAAIAQYQATRQITNAQNKAIQEALLEKALHRKRTINITETNIGPELQNKIDGVQDIVTLDDLVASLNTSSRAWELMIDKAAKEAVVEYYINAYQARGVMIRKPAGQYAAMIDAMTQASPGILDEPFDHVLQIAAIVEYDFDNGTDKDAMARDLLGEEEFLKNRQRLGLP